MNRANTITGRAILDRLHSEWRLKLLLLIALNPAVYLPYYYLQRHHFFPPTIMPASSIDLLIPFWSGATWFYLSIYLLMPLGPVLMTNRKQLLRYAAGIMLIGAIADIVFMFWPTMCPRPGAIGSIGAYRALIAIDTPYHACPSLHAAFAVFSAMCGVQVFRELNLDSPWRGALWLWVLIILAATLLTRQHVVLDLAAGALLGYTTYFLVFRERNLSQKCDRLHPAVNPKTNQTNSTAI